MEIFKNYNEKVLEYGKTDCHLMILEATGYDISSLIGKYSSMKSGYKVLPELTGFQSLGDYLLSIGYEEINPLLAQDHSIFISKVHSYIYYGGGLFGVFGEQFKFSKIKDINLTKFKVYRKCQQK